MDKIVYDSLYKFLVSIGLALIALPFIVIGLMYGIEPTLISATDYIALSRYSKDELLARESVRNHFVSNFELVLFIFVGVGLILIILGIYLWVKAHRLSVRKETLNVENQELNNQKLFNDLYPMSEKEVLQEVNDEVEKDEELNISVTLDENASFDNIEVPDYTPEDWETRRQRKEEERRQRTETAVSEYMIVEDAVFDKIKSDLGSEYDYKRNVRSLGTSVYSMDVIAVPKAGNTDLLYDIKYYKYPKRSTTGFAFQILKNWQIREEYEKTFERKAKSILIIVVSTENEDEAIRCFDKLIPQYDPSEFEVKYMTFEQLGIEI